MRAEVMSEAAKRKFLLSKDAMELLLSNNHPVEFANTVFAHLAGHKAIVTRQDLMDAITGDKVLFESMKDVKPHNSFTPDIHVIKDSDVTGESTCEGKIENFAQYFRNRYFSLRRIIESRSDFNGATSIGNLRHDAKEVRVVGLVDEVSETKNGHIRIVLEDDTGTVSVIITKDSKYSDEVFILDEAVGVIGKTNADASLIIAEKIVHPDVPRSHAWEPMETCSRVAFLSDVHVGSTTFLLDDWKRMISWLKANAVEQDINYLVLPGDVVDGIGVFPDQDKELVIKDIYEQYSCLAE